MIIHRLDYVPTGDGLPYSAYGGIDRNETGPYGVFINISEGAHKIKGNYWGWKAYEMLIHEFFHNIDLLIAKDLYCFANSKDTSLVKDSSIWNIIINEYRPKIIDGANSGRGVSLSDPVASYRKNTFNKDFIGNNILQKGNYSYFYECLKEGWFRQLCKEIEMIQKDKLNEIYFSSNGGLIDIVHGGCYFIYKVSDNFGYTAIYRHRKEFWDANPVFGLSSETFAIMAAAAIANHGTFMEIARILPKSCEYFEKILEKTCKMLEQLDK